MDVCVVLNLHDNDGVSHLQTPETFSRKTTVEELREAIYSFWGIHKKYQEIFYNGEQIFTLKSTFRQLGIKDNDEIVIKHTELARWMQYQICVEDVKKRIGKVIDNAHRAIQHHQQLMESKFFDVYLKFDEYRRQNQPDVASHTDDALEIMAATVKDHFLIQHGLRGGTSQSDFEYEWSPRSTDMRGTRNGLIVDVRLHGEEQTTKYSVKYTYSFKKSSPDIIELFSYKLLELLEVGPAVQFILPTEDVGSKTATYIASSWREDFIRLCDLSEKEFSIKALIQLRLLNVLCFIGDLHEDNCGQWNSTENAAVVDLIPLPYTTFTNVKRAVRAPLKLPWDEVPRKMLLEYPEEKFWDCAKECLDEWNLLEKMKLAQEMVVAEKNQLKKLDIECDGIDNFTETNELDNHVAAIRANLEELSKALGSSQ